MRNRFNIFFYLLGIIVSILLSFYVIDIKIEPKENEKFGLLVGSYDVSIKKEDLNLPESIKKVTIKNSTDFNLSVFVTAQSESKDYDLLILSKEDASSNKFYHSLLKLNENDLKSSFTFSSSYLVYQNEIYGIEITSKLEKYCKSPLSSTYYACFLQDSVHAGIFNNSSSSLSISIVNSL